MSDLFNGCSSLSTLPDISKWNLDKCTDISSLFKYCSKLTSLPDIAKWNICNVSNMSFTFSHCSSLTRFPNISGWNTINVRKIENIFEGCSSIINPPDISNWNLKNIIDKKSIEHIMTYIDKEDSSSLNISKNNSEKLSSYSIGSNYVNTSSNDNIIISQIQNIQNGNEDNNSFYENFYQ